MAKNKLVHSLLLSGILVSLVACASTAQDESSPGVLRGVFSTEQAEREAAPFRSHCQTCHIPRDFRSVLQQSQNNEALIADYDNLIRLTMPPESPGSLSEEMYLDIMAFLLSRNGFSASSE